MHNLPLRIMKVRAFGDDCHENLFAFVIGYSCLHVAAVFGHTAIVAYLIAKGEDVDLPDRIGRTPLMLATAHVKK